MKIHCSTPVHIFSTVQSKKKLRIQGILLHSTMNGSDCCCPGPLVTLEDRFVVEVAMPVVCVCVYVYVCGSVLYGRYFRSGQEFVWHRSSTVFVLIYLLVTRDHIVDSWSWRSRCLFFNISTPNIIILFQYYSPLSWIIFHDPERKWPKIRTGCETLFVDTSHFLPVINVFTAGLALNSEVNNYVVIISLGKRMKLFSHYHFKCFCSVICNFIGMLPLLVNLVFRYSLSETVPLGAVQEKFWVGGLGQPFWMSTVWNPLSRVYS